MSVSGVASIETKRVPGRKRLPRAAREQQLLDVAEALFVDAGYAETSIEDIARAAGVTRPIIYEHYGSKEGVYLGCVRRARRAFEQALVDLPPAEGDDREQFRRGADVYFRLLEDDPRRWELLFARTGLVADSLAASLTDERFRTVSLIADRYRASTPALEPLMAEALAHAVSGCAEQLGRWWLRHPELTRDEVVDLHVRFAWSAIEEERRRLGVGPTGVDVQSVEPKKKAKKPKNGGADKKGARRGKQGPDGKKGKSASAG